MSKASDFVRRPSSPSARMRRATTAGPSHPIAFMRVALMVLGGLGMAFLMYLNYHVKVEHAMEAARVGTTAVHEGSGILSHTRETWSREWRAVADRFSSLGTLVGDGKGEGEELLSNRSEIELYMMHTHERAQPAADEHKAVAAPAEVNVHGNGNGNGNEIIVFKNRGLQRALVSLSKHPIALGNVDISKTQLEDVLLQLYSQKECANLPLFVSMANVGSQLYWQMIENYIYTLVKFDLLHCAIMVCVSDQNCMRLCKENNFPCYDFNFAAANPNLPAEDASPSVMEQIAYLKLFHIPKALEKGVNVVLLDLDVGFLSNPKALLLQFMADKETDAYVQKDVTFIMNRTRAGWKQWWTEPMPNIGLFLVKGNERSCKMFARAWQDYTHNTKKAIKANPGKDQNKVAYSMSVSEHRDGFRWKYIPSSQVVLIDKYFKFADMSVELGGECTEGIFRNAKDPTEQFYQARFNRRNKAHLMESDQVTSTAQAIAVHTTCYEQRMKVNGLKAANAFWNPRYYDPNARTLTKKLVYDTRKQMTREVRSLAYLALRLNRTLIVPNVLAETRLVEAQHQRSNKGQRPIFQGNTIWPGFRVLYEEAKGRHNKAMVSVPRYEPAFYWRISREQEEQLVQEGMPAEEARQKATQAVPRPLVITVSDSDTLRSIEQRLQKADAMYAPRVVIRVKKSKGGAEDGSGREREEEEEEEARAWATHSVGRFKGYEEERRRYGLLPPMTKDLPRFRGAGALIDPSSLSDSVRLCQGILEPMKGNRSCFDKCK